VLHEAVGNPEHAHARARVRQAARDLQHRCAEAARALVLLERQDVAVAPQVLAELDAPEPKALQKAMMLMLTVARAQGKP